MLKDFLRRKEIIERSTVIANDIISRYPPELDKVSNPDNKAEIKKKQRKLLKALQLGHADIGRVVREMRLGVYGKAKFYKAIQDTMLEKGYTESSARIIIEELVAPF